MAYYVTGFYRDKKEAGYYIFDSNTIRTAVVSNKTIKGNEAIVKQLMNVRMSNYSNMSKPILLSKKMRAGYSIEYKPSIIENGEIVESNNTIVFIDFNKKMFGVVNTNSTAVAWYSINKLTEISKDEAYNNIAYSKETGLLDLRQYHIIGEDNKFEIKLNKFIVEAEVINDEIGSSTDTQESKVEEQDIIETTDDKINNDDKTESANSCKVVTELINWSTTKNSGYTSETRSITQKDFYESMLLMLRDDDIITLPTWVIKELGFKLKANIEMSMNLDKRVALGTIFEREKSMLVLVRYDSSVDYVKVQVVMSINIEEDKDYSIETVKSNFHKWRNSNKYVTI